MNGSILVPENPQVVPDITSEILKSALNSFQKRVKNCQGAIEISLKSLNIVEQGLHLNTTIGFEPDFFKLTWSLMNYNPICTDDIENTGPTIILDLTQSCPIDVNKKFVDYLAHRPIIFELYCISDEEENLVAAGDLYAYRILKNPNEKVTTTVKLYGTKIEKKTSAILIGTLFIEYEFNHYNNLHNSLISYNEKVLATSAPPESFTTVTPTIEIINNCNSEESKHKPTIQKEQNQPNWKRSMEEFAILKGQHPNVTKLNKWIEDNAPNISLRNYPRKRPDYKPEVKISIKKLLLGNESPILSNSKITQIYIDFAFLSHEGPSMESKSLHKPCDDKPLEYNFTKIFSINPKTMTQDCKLLAEHIKNDEDLKIDLVSEPEHTSEIHVCELIGTANINLFKLVQEELNTVSLNVPILTPTDKKEVGHLVVEIQGVQAMRQVGLDMLSRQNFRQSIK